MVPAAMGSTRLPDGAGSDRFQTRYQTALATIGSTR
jgi:hypothetical protein